MKVRHFFVYSIPRMKRALLLHASQFYPARDRIFCLNTFEHYPADKCRPWLDGYRSRTGTVALPFSRFERKVPKLLRFNYVRNPVTLGDKVRNRRIELRQYQCDASVELGIAEATLSLWELNKRRPHVSHYPKIIQYLGYIPFNIDTSTLGGRIKHYRYVHGLTQEDLAKKLAVDETSVRAYELNLRKPLKKISAKLELLIWSNVKEEQ